MSFLLGTLSTRILGSVWALPRTLWSSLAATGNVTPTITAASTTWGNALGQSARFGHTYTQFANLPPVPRLAGKGNAYQTTVERKRVIKDPNEPNFERVELIKWATTRMLRDVRRRHIFTRYFFNRSCLYNARKCRMLPNSIREAAFEEERRLPRDSMFHMLRSRCAVTGRSRGVLKKYRMSRLAWRNLADNNKLSGVIKASWG